jgi:1-acyl-sn-glycerol-3-phosphate acyltransferase
MHSIWHNCLLSALLETVFLNEHFENENMNKAPAKKRSIKAIDSIFGQILRHTFFALVRPYYDLFYNVSCSNKEQLQNLPGAIILSSHVSRHDPPLILSSLYTVTRIRPTAYYLEYEHWLQKYPMMLFGTIPMSSPKDWTPEQRDAQKLKTLDIMKRVLENNNSILIFPAGSIRTGEKEEIPSHMTGAYDMIKALPDRPVVLIKVDGLGKDQYHIYDQFWSFLGITKGRRHAKLELEIFKEFPNFENKETLNQFLENYFNNVPNEIPIPGVILDESTKTVDQNS